MDEGAYDKGGGRGFVFATDPTEDKSHRNGLGRTRSIDLAGVTKIWLKIGDNAGIDLEESSFFVSEEAEVSVPIFSIWKFHFGDKSYRGIRRVLASGEEDTDCFQGQGSHPARESGSSVGGVNPEMGQV
jgi:hypothetical protein